MLEAVLSLGLAGLVFGSLLGFAAKKFEVKTDPRVVEIREVLPGANCGGCGRPGCAALAEAICSGSAPLDACPVGGAAVAKKIAKIMGAKEVTDREPKVARLLCQGTCDVATNKYAYTGLKDCKAAAALLGGPKSCAYGCLGFGNCIRVCQFGAIRPGPGGVPVFDADKCTGCGKCAQECPKGLIRLVEKSKKVHVLCKNVDKGAVVRKICKVGCIGCRACVRACPENAITVENNLASIDYSKCTNCGLCVAKCPTKSIIMDGNVATIGQEAAS